MLSIRTAIDRFLREPPNSKPFSITAHPAFAEANKVLDAFVKSLGKLPVLFIKSRWPRSTSSNSLNLVSLDQQTAKIQHSSWKRLGYISVSFLGRGVERTSGPFVLICWFWGKRHKAKNIINSTEKCQECYQPTRTIPAGWLTPRTSQTGRYLLSMARQDVLCKLSRHIYPTWILFWKCCFRSQDSTAAASTLTKSRCRTVILPLASQHWKICWKKWVREQEQFLIWQIIWGPLRSQFCPMLIVSPGTSDLSQGTSRTKQSSHTTTSHHFGSSDECQTCWAAFSPLMAKRMEILMWMPCK